MPAPRAKVFISCGQDKQSDEVALARRICEALESLGFEGYIAVREQTLRGVKENILAQLASSEYFLFIDFKREFFRDSLECRGSLFSHQELAVAAYLDIEVLAFQEERVRKHDGLLGYLQANCIPFSDRETLPDLVRTEAEKRGWTPTWKSSLRVDFLAWSDAQSAADDETSARYYHIRVMNRHRSKPARNCHAYLALVRYPDLDNTALYFAPMELHWVGYPFPSALLAPRWWRCFDGFVVQHSRPTRAEFVGFATSTEVMVPPVDWPSTVHLTYAVISDDFPISLSTFSLRTAKSIDEIKFEQVDLDPHFKDGWPS